jgi:hypothetical protein
VQAGRLGRLTLAEYVELLGAGPASELALRCAGFAGIVAGGPAPPVTQPAPSPVRRRRRRLTDFAYEELVVEVMRAAPERPRPEAVTTKELDRLISLLSDDVVWETVQL